MARNKYGGVYTARAKKGKMKPGRGSELHGKYRKADKLKSEGKTNKADRLTKRTQKKFERQIGTQNMLNVPNVQKSRTGVFKDGNFSTGAIQTSTNRNVLVSEGNVATTAKQKRKAKKAYKDTKKMLNGAYNNPRAGSKASALRMQKMVDKLNSPLQKGGYDK